MMRHNAGAVTIAFERGAGLNGNAETQEIIGRGLREGLPVVAVGLVLDKPDRIAVPAIRLLVAARTSAYPLLT